MYKEVNSKTTKKAMVKQAIGCFMKRKLGIRLKKIAS